MTPLEEWAIKHRTRYIPETAKDPVCLDLIVTIELSKEDLDYLRQGQDDFWQDLESFLRDSDGN